MQGLCNRTLSGGTERIVAELSSFTLEVGGRTLLSDISAEFGEGKRYVISGPSGAGKSSLALSLAGLTHEIRGARTRGRLRIPEGSTSIVFQNPFLQMFHTTVYEEVHSSLLSASAGRAEVLGALEAFGAAGCIDRDVFSLSAGERKRVCLAAALASQPDVLILDEPTGYLDREGIEALRRALASLDARITVIIFDHRTEPFMDRCDRFILLSGGRQVLSCSHGEVRSYADELRTYGVRYPWKWEDVRVTLPDVRGAGNPPLRKGDAREPVVRSRKIRAGYGGKRILRDIDIDLFPGEITALIGDNGSGKSTLGMVLAGAKRKSRGKLRYARGLRRVMMFQCVSDQLICGSVDEETRNAFYGGTGGRGGVPELIDRLDLRDLTARVPRSLSMGEQHRTILAALLASEPDLIILDEPALGADWAHIEAVFSCLRDFVEKDAAVLVITHDDKLVCRYADRVVRMERGRIAGDYSTRFTERDN
ncbi:MAG: ATP-binding cassette domain-containing protein [bacterium]